MQAPNSSTSMTAPIEAVRLLRNSYQAFEIAVAMRRLSRGAGGARQTIAPSTSLSACSSDMADPLGEFDARVEEPVGQVDQQVHDDDDAAQDQHARLDQRIVALQDRLEDRPTDARPGEDRLQHH